jgi:hypothetical protein
VFPKGETVYKITSSSKMSRVWTAGTERETFPDWRRQKKIINKKPPGPGGCTAPWWSHCLACTDSGFDPSSAENKIKTTECNA